MGFFMGVNEVPVIAKQYGKPVEHYAWCLDVANLELFNAPDKRSQIQVLNNFEKNMRQLPATQEMLHVIEDTFQAFLTSSEVYSKQYILTFLSGIRIPGQGYISSCQ